MVWGVQVPVPHTSLKAVGTMVLQELGLIMTTSNHFLKMISMLERPWVRAPTDSPSWAQPSTHRCQGVMHPTWGAAILGPPQQPIFQMSNPGCPCPGYQRARRFSQVSSTQILNQQNPGAMKNSCCFKPLSIIGGVRYATTDTRMKSIYTHRQSMCACHMCMYIKVFHNFKKNVS